MTHSRPGPLVPSLALLTLAVALAGCGGGTGDTRRSTAGAGACAPATDALAHSAVLEYLKLQTDPYPQRFLVAAGTDSALPESGLRALQDKGPTYFYPADTTQRAKVRAKLDSVGTYTTILLAWKGMESSDTASAVRLSGTFVGGKHDGRTAPSRTMHFACDSTGWHYTRADSTGGA